MKRILTYIIAALALLSACSCSKKAGFDHPLGLISEVNRLSSASGSTPVVVLSNTNWTARFEAPVDWAALDRLGGTGNGQVIFSYDVNIGDERSVVIVFTAGDVEKKITMIQAKGN